MAELSTSSSPTLEPTGTVDLTADYKKYAKALYRGRDVRPVLAELCQDRLEAWEEAAEAKDPLGLILLAEAHAQKLHPQRKRDEIVPLFRAAADAGHLDGIWLLAECHFDGLGTPRDRKRAKQLYEQGAEAKHALAEFSLGLILAEG
ncbi:MAG: tetratricopeptide repeat protein, partial [Gemmataceae bacterium]